MVDFGEKFIFFDNGYDSLKAAVFTSNLYSEYDYLHIPTFAIPFLAEQMDQGFPKIKNKKDRLNPLRRDKLEKLIEENVFQKVGYTWDNLTEPVLEKAYIKDLPSYKTVWQGIARSFDAGQSLLKHEQVQDFDAQTTVIIAEPKREREES